MLIASLIGIFAAIGISVWIFRTRKNVASLIHRPEFVPDLGAMHLIERFGEPISGTVATTDTKEHQKHLIELLEKPVSGEESSRSSSSTSAISSSSMSDVSKEVVRTTIEGAAQGTLFSMDAIQNLMEIDEHVYTAMGTLAGEQLVTIGDLSKHLASWESAEIGEPLPQAAVYKLMGHLSEPIVAENLRELGYQVEMPDISNQEGYDLVLNGEYFANVKTVADASSLADHFDKYPHIPVIVPRDMAEIPEDAIYLNKEDSIEQLEEAVHEGREGIVLVDGELSRADMGEYTEAVNDGLLGNVDIVGGGVPLITLASSGWREIRLLQAQKTDLRHAAKNLGLDVSTTAIGGGAGLASGAGVGTIIFPGIGTTICGIIGGIAGSIVGRLSSNRLKKKPLIKAVREYDKASEESEKKIQSLQEDSLRKFKSSVRDQTDKLKRLGERCTNELEQQCSDVVLQRRNICRINSEEARSFLKSILTELNDRLSLLKRIPMWKHFVLGRDLSRSLRELISQSDQRVRHLESEAVRIIESSPQKELTGGRAIQFLQLMLYTEEGIIRVREMLGSFEKQRKDLENGWQIFITEKRDQLAHHRHQCMKDLSDTIQELNNEVSRGIGGIRKQLELLLQKVKTEQGRLGL